MWDCIHHISHRFVQIIWVAAFILFDEIAGFTIRVGEHANGWVRLGFGLQQNYRSFGVHKKVKLHFDPRLGSRCVTMSCKSIQSAHVYLEMEVTPIVHILTVVRNSPNCNSILPITTESPTRAGGAPFHFFIFCCRLLTPEQCHAITSTTGNWLRFFGWPSLSVLERDGVLASVVIHGQQTDLPSLPSARN